MGPFGVTPKPFRVESHFEWRVLSKSRSWAALGSKPCPKLIKIIPKLIIWSIWVALGRKGFEIILKLILWSIRAASGLGPEMVPKQTAGFSEQHPPSAWGLFKQHPPRVWGLPGLFKQLSKRHPTKTWRLVVATIGAEWLNKLLNNPLRHVWATTPKNHIFIHFFTKAPVAGFWTFKRDPPRDLRPLSKTLRGFWCWPVATPRAEGGRGEVNLRPLYKF